MGIDRVLLRPADVSHKDLALMVAFFSIACYNVFEIFVWIFVAFKSPRSLYFWSMQTATWGILIHAIFTITGTFGFISTIPAGVGIMIGYYAMIAAPLFVLYSRLHLVVTDARKIRWVLYMIITLTSILVILATILFFGALRRVPNFANTVSTCSKVLLTCFCVVEVFLSGVYIGEAFVGLKPVFAVKGREGREMLIHLVFVYIFVIILLGTLLMLDYAHFYWVEIGYSPFVYSVKLKLEFGILTKLVNLIQKSHCGCSILHPWNSSHDSHAIRLDPCLSPSNPTSSPEQRRSVGSTPTWGSMRELYGTAQERNNLQLSVNESNISLPPPARALSSDHLSECRV